MNTIALPPSPGVGAIDPSTPSDRRTDTRFDGTPRHTATGKPPPTTSSGNDSAIAATGRASDTVSLTPQARASAQAAAVQSGADAAEADNDPRKDDPAVTTNPRGRDGEPLSNEEAQQVQELKARDAEVRRHEQAHVAAGGPYVTSGPSYEYQQGPDGKRYAVGGSVGIDTSPEDTPAATITKAQTVRRAALAPAEPSTQDRRVAAQASQMEQQARAELAAEQQAEREAEASSEEDDGATKTDRAVTPMYVQKMGEAYAGAVPASYTYSITA